MPFRSDLRTLRCEPHFPRLLGTRLVSQASDGVLQVGLASAVFFNPERATDARQAAAGFAVLLLPYSLVGPFAGVLLDRWRRQVVIVRANYVRAAIVCTVAGLLATLGPTSPAFFLAALAAVSVNRFFLSALAASLPHVVRRPQLVLANSVSATSGYVATISGGLIGLTVGAVGGVGDISGDMSNAAVVLTAAAGYGVSSRVAAGFPDPGLLGPDAAVPVASTVAAGLRDVGRGLAEGGRHVWSRRPAAYALCAMGAHRFFYGVSTIATLLLYRNYFTESGVFRAGLVGLGQVFLAGAVGVVAAAAVTPSVTARIGKPRWIVTLFALACVVEVVLGLPYTQPALLGAALLLAFAAQAAKICVDTIVQETVDDGMRGRVFACYDTVFNVMFVAAAMLGAVVLPDTGKSYAVLTMIAVGYGATSLLYGVSTRRLRLRADAAVAISR